MVTSLCLDILSIILENLELSPNESPRLAPAVNNFRGVEPLLMKRLDIVRMHDLKGVKLRGIATR